jgi:hypothetical protein
MGGLVVDVASIHNTLKKVVITPNGLLRLTELGHFIHVSDQQIRDLDRWDTLGKSIAIMQAFWIIVQCIGRRGARLPISLLELNTCVNVGFAFCLRLLWNEKPFDIQSPIVVDDKAFRGVTALMLMETSFASPSFFKESVYICVYRPVPLPQNLVTDVSPVSNVSAVNDEDHRGPGHTSRKEEIDEPALQPQQPGFKIITYLSQLPTPKINCNSIHVPVRSRSFAH